MLCFRPLAALVLVLLSGAVAPAGAAPGRPAKNAPSRPTAESAEPHPTLAAAASAPTPVLSTASNVALSGMVTNDADAPLPGATVWVTNHPRQMAVTNAAGEFTLLLLNNQPVQISCAYAGCQEARIALRCPKDKKDFYVSLQPQARLR
jgi:hypothetical protein